MKICRLLVLAATALNITSCKVIEAPFNMAGRLFQSVGRTVGLSSNGNPKPEDFQIDARAVHEAVAANAPRPAQSDEAATAVAQR